MSRFRFTAILCGVILIACACSRELSAQTVVQPSAVILQAARVQAAQQKKIVFLVFSASWSQPSRILDTFMNDKQIHAILDKYFVPATIHVSEEAGKGGRPEWNSFGGDGLMARMGGVNKEGKKSSLPFFAFVDTDGNLIVNSIEPTSDKAEVANIGYPSNSEQIAWFMTMLKKGVPTMAPEDSAKIEDWIKKHDPASMAPPSGGRGRR